MSGAKRVEALPALAGRIVAWQRRHGRHDLPWVGSRDPYRVWLSEIMLQQTQVSVVLPYYRRFLARFADVAALAAAPQDAVLAEWAGLGYYSRARNLHRCAQAVMAEHGGRFPQDAETLSTLPGIGRSTAAAIAAFCFEQRAAILDGNVKRVLARALGFAGDLARASEERALWQDACALLPEDGADMPAYTQGLMDIGATICLPRKPHCLLCPLAEPCVARAEGGPERYPVKSKRLVRSQRTSWWLWLDGPHGVWLQQRPAHGVWGGLWTLPVFEDEAALITVAQRLAVATEVQPALRHALTHFDWTLHPRRAVLDGNAPDATALAALLGPGRWVAASELGAHALPAPLAKLLAAPRASAPATSAPA